MITESTITTAEPAALPSIAAELARLTALATLRLTEKTGAPDAPVSEPDRLLTAEQAAPLVGLTVAQLVRKRDLPFRRRVGARTIRFSARGIERWQRRSAP